MQKIRDLLEYYQISDVKNFVKALRNYRDYFRQMHLDIYKGEIFFS
jgi:hypothetical protein